MDGGGSYLLSAATGSGNRRSFINHVFATTDESKSEVLNSLQYAVLSLLPVVLLNKTVSLLIPEPDTDKSSLEVIAEVLFQVAILFVGIILVHRVITYIPTYSGYSYDALSLVHLTIPFMVLLLSMQSKIGTKVNILVERVVDLWNGETHGSTRKRARVASGMMPGPSMSTNFPNFVGNPASTPTSIASSMPSSSSLDIGVPTRAPAQTAYDMLSPGPLPASSVLGSSFA